MRKHVILFVLIFTVLNFCGWSQMKTSFTQEKRPENSNPTGMASADTSKQKNSVDVYVPAKTRGIERYQKLNVFGQAIGDEFLFYRGLLSDNQKVVYDQVYKALMNGEKTVNLQAKITQSELGDALNAVRYDNPEAFWWSGEYSWWYNSDGIPTSVELSWWMDDSNLQTAYTDFWYMTVPIIYYAATLPDEMSKIKYIHDYICLSTEYDYDSYNSGNYGGKLQTAYSCAVDYKTVCAGYSSCFEYYMQQLGIPCVSVWGSGHQWNFIKIDGQYYQMDVTWNDTKVIPTYYNLKHQDMQKVESHTLDTLPQKLVKKYPSTSDSMNYVKYHGFLLEGSPYTYQELGYFDYNLEVQDITSVFSETPRKIEEVTSESQFQKLLQNELRSTSGNTFSVQCAIKDDNLSSKIYSDLTGDTTLTNAVYELRPSASGYSYNYNYDTISGYKIVNYDFTLR